MARTKQNKMSIDAEIPHDIYKFMTSSETVEGWRICLWCSIFQYYLGPNKHGLVTYIQVNVYIGNTLSWLNGG